MENYKKYVPAVIEDLNPMEIWLPVKDYEGLYEVSNLGKVRSLNYLGHGRTWVLKPYLSKGYLIATLRKDGIIKRHLVHRIVWNTFFGDIPDDLEIDHRNGVRDDNRMTNLRCISHIDNMRNPVTKIRHKMANGNKSEEWLKNIRKALKDKYSDEEFKKKMTDILVERNKKMAYDPKWREKVSDTNRKRLSKKVDQYTKNDEYIRTWECINDAAKELHIDGGQISKCCKKREGYTTAGGYKWCYKNE